MTDAYDQLAKEATASALECSALRAQLQAAQEERDRAFIVIAEQGAEIERLRGALRIIAGQADPYVADEALPTFAAETLAAPEGTQEAMP